MLPWVGPHPLLKGFLLMLASETALCSRLVLSFLRGFPHNGRGVSLNVFALCWDRPAHGDPLLRFPKQGGRVGATWLRPMDGSGGPELPSTGGLRVSCPGHSACPRTASPGPWAPTPPGHRLVRTPS